MNRSILYILAVVGIILVGAGVWFSISLSGSSPEAPTEQVITVTYFPVQKSGYFEKGSYLPYSTGGELVISSGYLRLRSSSAKEVLLIWPPDSRLTINGNTLAVADGKGNILARVGQEISMRGVEVSADVVKESTGYGIPEGCDGPYLLVAP